MMDDFEYTEPGRWIGTIISGTIVLFIILCICLNDGCRDKIHRIYNLIPPQKAKLTIQLQRSPGDLLSNQLLILDAKDSLTSDNEGEIVIDDLPVGKHSYSILYGDSLRRYTLNLKRDSQMAVILYLQGNDIVKGRPRTTVVQRAAGVQSQKGKTLTYNPQWFTVGKSVQFGPICIKLVKIVDGSNTIYVNICHTNGDFNCQTTIAENSELSRDNWIRFIDGDYDYRLVLNRIDNTPQVAKNAAAFVSMVQIAR